MSLNKQFVLDESATKKQGIDEMSSFVHAFYNVTSSVLQEKEKKAQSFISTNIPRRSETWSSFPGFSRKREDTGNEVDSVLTWRHGSHIGAQNNKMAVMLVCQTNPVEVQLFFCSVALVCSNKFAWLLTTWVKTLNKTITNYRGLKMARRTRYMLYMEKIQVSSKELCHTI